MSARAGAIAAFDGYLITPTGLPYDGPRRTTSWPMPLDGAADAARRAVAVVGMAISPRHLSRPGRRGRDRAHARAVCDLARLPPSRHPRVPLHGRGRRRQDIRCAPYATFGTQALSDHAVAALEGRRACLLANHGMIAPARRCAAALALAVEVETLAEMYWRALQIGEPALLADAEMDVVLESSDLRPAGGVRSCAALAARRRDAFAMRHARRRPRYTQARRRFARVPHARPPADRQESATPSFSCCRHLPIATASSPARPAPGRRSRCR